MSARTRPHAADGPGSPVVPENPVTRLGLPPLLSLALGLAVLGSAVATLGSAVAVVDGARPGYLAWPVLGVLALLPAAVAVVFAVRGRTHLATGVLAAGAVLASGRVLLDAQFVLDSSRASRPELHVADTLGAADPAAGVWLLLASHVLALAAGVLALNSLDHGDEEDGPSRRARQQALTASTLLGLLAGVALVLPGFRSDNAYLLAGSALDGPELVVGGTLVLAVAIPASAALSVTARSWQVTRGVLFGLAAGVVVLVVPDLVSALALPWLHFGPRPVAGLVAAAGLAGFATWPIGDKVSGRPPADGAVLPDRTVLHRVAGGLALATAAFGVAGGRAPQVVSVLDATRVEAPAGWLLVVASLLLAVPAALMLVGRRPAAVRPALSVLWAGVVLAGMFLVATPVVAARVPGAVAPGAGVWLAVAALAGALVLGAVTAVAGVVDRDAEDALGTAGPDEQGEGERDRRSTVLAAAAAVTAVGAFGFSTVEAPDFAGSGLWQDFGVQFWGQLVALAVVLGALALAPRCRPARAAALLAGVAGVLLVRALELPLAGKEIDGAAAGLGTWLAVVCLALVAAGALDSALSHRDSRQR